MVLRRKKHNGRASTWVPLKASGLEAYLARYLLQSEVQGVSKDTLRRRESALRRFIVWCQERSLENPQEITKPILENYQRYLYFYRKANGEPLTTASQNVMLTPIKSFFKWLMRENYLLYNPASELQPPRKGRRLPRAILSVEEIMLVMEQPNLEQPQGVRDRAILELLYSTGIRRMELVNLTLDAVNVRRNTLMVRSGKGGHDRYVPLGERAANWLSRYLRDVRPQLLLDVHEAQLFLSDYGMPLTRFFVGGMAKDYLRSAGITVAGSCHLFRHAMATHMLENGADIRFIQAMLGHADLTSTEIYTHVSIRKLQEIHAATHPAKLEDKKSLLAQLAAEMDEDE